MTSPPDAARGPIALWGGVEATVNRVGDRFFDQMQWSGHADRLDDLDLIAALGVSAVRYPVLWERVAPVSLDRPSWAWSDQRLTRLRTLGVRPIVGLLHHGSGPRYTSLLDPGFPALFAAYAAMVAARYPWVTDYTPINEPGTTARFSSLYGHWYPHARSDEAFVRALLHQIQGIAAAMRAIRRVNPAARLIQTDDLGACSGSPDLADQVAFENQRRWLTWDLLLGRVTTTHPLWSYLCDHGATVGELEALCVEPCHVDIVGVNCYVTSDRYLDSRLDHHPPDTHGGNGRQRYADLAAVRVASAGLVGHRTHLVAAGRRYDRPVALTEVHLACTRDEQVRWLHDAWDGAIAARAAGVEVAAVTPWALFGSYDWDTLVTAPTGRYECGAFDVRSGMPRPTAVAVAIQALALGAPARPPALAGPGWWRRHDEVGATAPPASVPPLLIVGANGTLGNALRHAARARGLPVAALGRAELDVRDDTAIRAALDRWQPWAVINASGYVRPTGDVDVQHSRVLNVWAAVALNRECAARGLPCVTYSSDLVFDGRRPQYGESAAVSPAGEYGRSKALADAAILGRYPFTALVLRTSAFFGPWDRANFAVGILERIARGKPASAAGDVRVTPTYVPHLAHASLDLLIDGERGLWHLAGGSALSWCEFGQAVAERFGFAPSLVVPERTATACSTALVSERGVVMPPLSEALDDFRRHLDPGVYEGRSPTAAASMPAA